MHTNFFHSLWQLECPGRDSNPPPCGSWQTMQLLPGSTGAGSTSRGSSCSHSWDCCSFWNTKHFQMKLSSHDEVCEVDASTQKSVKFKSSESVWWFENSQDSFQNTKPLLFKYIYIFFSWKFSLIRDCTTSNCDLTHQWPFPLLHFGVELLKNLSQNRTNRKYKSRYFFDCTTEDGDLYKILVLPMNSCASLVPLSGKYTCKNSHGRTTASLSDICLLSGDRTL